MPKFPANNSFLYLEDVTKAYSGKTVLADIDLAVRQYEFCTVVGPSGCGKSTLLRLILGQEVPTSGRMTLESKEIGPPASDRGIVYQRYSLYPHLTVAENIMLGKLLPKAFWKGFFSKKTARAEALEYLENVQLAEHADKYPYQLSGGMQQRVAIAQALITRPKILLMDEPFGALDPGTREAMQVLILALWKAHKMTVFFVTHDLEEAVFLGTRLLVLSQFYTEDITSKGKAGHGSRIVADYPLAESRSTHEKATADFGQLLEKIRLDGFDPEYRQHITQFNLEHPDSFQTM